MKHVYLILLLSILACNKQEQESSTVTIRLTNDTSQDLFGLTSNHDDSFYGDINVSNSSSYDHLPSVEFAYGNVYPSQQFAITTNGDTITIGGMAYCGTGLYFETAAPGVYDFSIQYFPQDTIDIGNGMPYIRYPYYSFVPKP